MNICMYCMRICMCACIYVYMHVCIIFIWFGTRQQLAKLDLSAIAADFPHFIFSPVVLYLGVTLDQELTLFRIFTASVVIHTTNFASSALLFALLPQSLPLHLSMPSLQLD